MKLTGLVVPPDDRELYKTIAAMALDGDKETPKKAAAVALYETAETGENPETGMLTTSPIPPPTKEAVAKLVATLRSRLASVDMGRFSVSHNGGPMCYVTVNDAAPRKRATKPKPAAPKPAAKAAGK